MHVLMYDSKSGILEKVSASLLVLPGLYLIVKLKSANSLTHRKPVAFNFANIRT